MTTFHAKIFAAAATLAIATTTAFAQTSFTHVARIPAGSDISSIKFQSVKAVMLPTRNVITADARYCEQAASRDPGGSMFCPQVTPDGYEHAYEVTYSYTGPAMASDEQSNTRYTFRVYLRPEELDQADRNMLSHWKAARADVAGSFRVTTSREPEARMVMDEPGSTVCEGSYVDGRWMPSKSTCRDNIKYKMVTVPSDYIAVRVDLAPARVTASAALIQ